jgi:D-glycero-D-manno-heptose 1,7-bisphosphate phosphatase
MRAVFLDRDGVINRKALDGEYIANWRQIEIVPGSVEATAALKEAGYLIFVITNQRGVATGKIREADLEEIHNNLKVVFRVAGAAIADVYCCSHALEARCSCRKPRPGMLYRAAREHDLQLADCWMVGDSATDVEAGMAAGCKTVQIVTGQPGEGCDPRPHIEAESLRAAVPRILEWDNDGEYLASERLRS